MSCWCATADIQAARRYYEDVADLDMSAIINHHAHMEDIDVNALAAAVTSNQLHGPATPSGKEKRISLK